MTSNPYSAPEAIHDDGGSLSHVERTRYAHLECEAGILWCSEQVGWVALALVIGGILLLEMHALPAFRIPWAIGMEGVGACLMWVHLGLNQLRPAIRKPAMVVAAVALLAFPVGTALGGYLLYLLRSDQGKYVFTPAYHHVVEVTPHIRPQTTTAAWLFRAGLLALAATAAGVFFWRR